MTRQHLYDDDGRPVAEIVGHDGDGRPDVRPAPARPNGPRLAEIVYTDQEPAVRKEHRQ